MGFLYIKVARVNVTPEEIYSSKTFSKLFIDLCFCRSPHLNKVKGLLNTDVIKGTLQKLNQSQGLSWKWTGLGLGRYPFILVYSNS